jgi:thermitase
LSDDELSKVCTQVNCTIIRKLEFSESLYYLLAPEAQNAYDVFAAVQQLNESTAVEWAVPNVAFQPKLCGQVVPNDEYFPNQWYLHNTGKSGVIPNADINAPEAWDIITGDPNIVVAVLDSGVDSNHPDLINNLVRGYDFIEKDNSPDPLLGESAMNAHGTACAGLIAAQANNSIGVAGVAPRCKIMPIRIFRFKGEGSAEWVSDATTAEAILWAAENGADIISLSWGSNFSLPITREAIISATVPDEIGRNGKGCVVLSAAGNQSDNIDYDYPAAYPEVIAVGATDDNDQRWDYSNYGSLLEIMAPSGCGSQNGCMTKLWTTDITGNDGLNDSSDPHLILDYTDHFSGTSAACSIATGVAALILSVNPNLMNSEVRSILLRSALDLGPSGWDKEYGFGRVDAYAAVTMALDPQWVSTIFVDDDAPNDPGPSDPNISDPIEDGSSEHPFDSIQEAVNNAIPRDTVVIRAGTYAGKDNYDINFLGKAITIRGEDGPVYCIIDCGHLGRGFLFDSLEGPDSVLEGLTITDGYSNYAGGGIYCGSDSNPTIVSCILRDNTAVEDGGGMYNNMSHPNLINCTFIGNSAESGGGINNRFRCSPTLIDCTFIGNSAKYGGGMYNTLDSKPTLLACTFNTNSAESGGGIYNRYDSSPSVTNCIFNSNSADYGGGIHNQSKNSPVLINCTFVRNSAQNGCTLACDYEEQIYPGNVKLANCIIRDGSSGIWNNDGSTIEITYSNIEGGQAGLYDPLEAVIWGQGNIDVDPLFADFDIDNYYLKSQAGRWNPAEKIWVLDDVTSPCIDAGDPNSPVVDEPEPNGGRVNMGAYGGTAQAGKSSSDVHAKYGGGELTDPYLIYTPRQMNEIGANPIDWDKHFKLMADIDLSVYIGTSYNIIGRWNGLNRPGNIPFTGVFDGNHHTISNFSYTSTYENGIGLFGYIGDPNAEIRDLGLIDCSIKLDWFQGDYVGSLAGFLSDGSISGCYSQGSSVVASANVGGLIGRNGGIITNCYANGLASGKEAIGGLVGFNTGTITNSFSKGTTYGEYNCVGGLIGSCSGSITNCYSQSTVFGAKYWGIGGLVGHNAFGTITNCYSVGSVFGSKLVGGLLGSNTGATVINCFWDIETSGQTSSNGGVGRTTADMKTALTFLNVGWDFVDETENGNEDIWWILEGRDYPRLWWEAAKQ